MRSEKRGKGKHPRKMGHASNTNLVTKNKEPICPEKPIENQENADVQTPFSQNAESTYRRRKIESNWEKYEIEEEEIDVAPDYKEVINKASLSSSHFRLESEIDWTNAPSDADESSNDMAAYLSLDCNELAHCLRGIAFHRRLMIDDGSIFTQEQMDGMQEEADFYSREYSSRMSTMPKLPRTAQTIIKKLVKDDNRTRNDERNDDSSDPTSSAVAKHDAAVVAPWTDDKDQAVRPAAVACPAHIDDSDEEQLDLLLSLDVPQQSAHGPEPQTSVTRQVTEQVASSACVEEETTSDLEDWLDSVLDA